MAAAILNLTEQTFDDAVATGLNVIDFWAGWCAPCRAMAPQLEKAAAARPEYRFAKVDVDAQPALAARFGIQSIPTLIVFIDGEPIAAQSGVIRGDQLVGALDNLRLTHPRADAEPSAGMEAA